MSKLFKISKNRDATLLYFLNYILLGFIHQRDMNKVKGIIIGLWRFQLQISIGYSDEMENIGEIANA